MTKGLMSSSRKCSFYFARGKKEGVYPCLYWERNNSRHGLHSWNTLPYLPREKKITACFSSRFGGAAVSSFVWGTDVRLRQRRVDSLKLSSTLMNIHCYIYYKIELTRAIRVIPIPCQKGVSRNVIHPEPCSEIFGRPKIEQIKSWLKLMYLFLSGISMPPKQEWFVAQHQLVSLRTSYGNSCNEDKV